MINILGCGSLNFFFINKFQTLLLEAAIAFKSNM